MTDYEAHLSDEEYTRNLKKGAECGVFKDRIGQPIANDELNKAFEIINQQAIDAELGADHYREEKKW